MNKALVDLIRISNATGKDPMLTQGLGGNTSVKTDNGKYMYIKASGTALKNMSIKSGWCKLRLDAVLSIVRDEQLAKLSTELREPIVANRLVHACDDNVKNEARPSIEAPLHALLDKCVIHLHPVMVGAYVSAKRGRAAIEDLFNNERHPPLWIPHAPSGLTLARKVSQLVASYRKRHGIRPGIIMLAKHGLFVSAKTPNEAVRLVHRTINRCKSKLPKSKLLRHNPPAARQVRVAKSAIRRVILDVRGKCPSISYFFNKYIAEFMSRKDTAELLAKGPLGAAELVYAGGPPVWVESPSKKKIKAVLKAVLRKNHKSPMAFVVKGLGLFVAADNKNASSIANVITSSLIIRGLACRFGGVLSLTRGEQDFIKRWYSLPPRRPRHPMTR